MVLGRMDLAPPASPPAARPSAGAAIVRSQARAAPASAEVVVEHAQAVRGYLAGLGVATGAVDDLAQDVFVAALAGWDAFDQDRPVRAWLFGIARNIAHRHWRQARRPSTDAVRHALLDLAATDPEPAADALHGDAVVALTACLDQLAPPARELVIRHYHRDESLTTIASDQGRQPGALRMALLRVRDALRSCIATRLARAP
jgi:RNA polymerase sigma-70 factor, ECF subfamily